MSHESSVNLLVVSRSLNDTEMYVNALRNAGLAVHATRVEDENGLSEALADQACDMLLCDREEDGIDTTRIMTACEAAKTDVPLIMVSTEWESATMLQAMRAGARDCVPKNDLEHLQLATTREISALRTRRELAAAKQQLQEAEKQRNTLIESSRDAIAYVHEGMYVMTNPAYLKLFGFAEMDELEGIPIMDMVVADQQKQLKSSLRALDQDADNANSHLELTCQKNDGSTFDALLEFTEVRIDGEPCTQIVIRGQADSKELEQQLHLLSSKDSQTGLFNRQYFLDSLEKHLQEPGKSDDKPALLYIALDDFQELRDSVGLAASDTVIRQIAELFQDQVDQDSVLTRFGDLTFTLLAPHAEAYGENGLAQILCRSVDSKKFGTSSKFIGVTCSIGVAPCTGNDVSVQDLVNRAYTACKTAQQDGGNEAVLFEPKTTAVGTVEGTSDKDAETSRLIKTALEQERFRLVYQPIVSLQGDSRENYAVLLRMLDDNGDENLPKDFLDQAAHDGLMGEVDRWVVKHAGKELESQRKDGRKTVFFINLSVNSLKDETFLLFVCDCLRDFNIKGSWFCFQLKDDDIRQHINTAQPLLEGLKKIKCQLAIDRFGLSPEPADLLKRLDFDYAKLDASFMKDLATDQKNQDRLNAIHEIVRSHDIKSVATAVEDANSLAILWTVGLDYIQGYFLQEPSATIDYNFQQD